MFHTLEPPAVSTKRLRQRANLHQVRGWHTSLTCSSCPTPSGADQIAMTDLLPMWLCLLHRHVSNFNRHWRKTMPNKGSSENNHEKESGARRTANKLHDANHPLVPANESTKESGPRRLYAASDSVSSTSSKEGGARRMYASAGSAGHHAAKP